MFGPFDMHPGGGVFNPPYSPAYPVEWSTEIHTLEVITRVDPGRLEPLLADTGFDLVNDRVAFRFMLSPGHTLSLHRGRMFDLMVTVAVRYQDLFTQTHLYMYCSDPMGIAAGRELFGYTKKDCDFEFQTEAVDGRVTGSVAGEPCPSRRSRSRQTRPLRWCCSPTKPSSRPVNCTGSPSATRPRGCRRLVRRRGVSTHAAPVDYSEPVRGRIDLQLLQSPFDPLTDLQPTILGRV